MTKPTLSQTICDMLTENTGTHMLDSGGSNGRCWQRNQGLTVDALEAMPSATLQIYYSEKWGYDLSPTINVYHFLRDSLTLDEYCQEFNAIPANDWNGCTYGLSAAGQEWLLERDFRIYEENTFNTYNWESQLSQVLQYTYLKSPEFDGHGDDRGDYILLQVHGGADVRGGYTDAKLFKINCDYFGYESCGFSVELPDVDTKTPNLFDGSFLSGFVTLDWSGEWITSGGSCACNEYLSEFGKLAFDGLEGEQSSVTIAGDYWGAC